MAQSCPLAYALSTGLSQAHSALPLASRVPALALRPTAEPARPSGTMSAILSTWPHVPSGRAACGLPFRCSEAKISWEPPKTQSLAVRAWGQLCGLTAPSRGFLRPRRRLPEIPGVMGAGFREPHLRPPCGSRGPRGRVWAAPNETRPSFHLGRTPEEQGELLSEGVLGKSRRFCRWSRCLCDLGRPCLRWGPIRRGRSAVWSPPSSAGHVAPAPSGLCSTPF